MRRPALLLLPAALLLLAAAPAKAPAAKPTTARSATAKPAAAATKPAPARAPPVVAFDATSPQGLLDVLSEAGATVQSRRREEDGVFVTVTSTVANFSMQFAGCDPQGRACRAVLLDSALTPKPLTAAQVNAFNQSSVMCRVYQASGGQPHVIYSTLLSKSLTRDDVAMHFQAWQGCLADGQDFLRDPAAFLANAS